nr:uncharacterized protein LOC111419068 [Onthophagus taurus]
MLRSTTSCLFIFVFFCGQKNCIFCDADVYWRDYNGSIPSDAFPTYHGNYIAQVVYYVREELGVVPGTLYPESKIVISESAHGKITFKDNIKILCTTEPTAFEWMYVNVEQLKPTFLQNCVIGGGAYYYNRGVKVYIGKIFHEGQWKIGKVFGLDVKQPGLKVWWNNGRTYWAKDFQILRKLY